MQDFGSGAVDCCSAPLVSLDNQSDKAAQVSNWWTAVEQQSIVNSMEFTHMLQTDVSDCYGSIYTHSISWAIDGLEAAKDSKGQKGMLGEKIDHFIRACRYGQMNGIPQGSVLMDLIAEIVLGYVDKKITTCLDAGTDFKILRYRDDYRIYTNNDERAENILKVISDCLRSVRGIAFGI